MEFRLFKLSLKNRKMLLSCIALVSLLVFSRAETGYGQDRADSLQWLQNHVEPIRSLSSEDYSDLQFLEPLLSGKRIIQLGESAHGVAEFNKIKVRLIKYLHRELGYEVIAFESGLFECHQANRKVDDLTAIQLMKNCIFSVWWTEEVVELFEYIKKTRNSDKPLLFTGFDIQVSSSSVRERPKLLYEMLHPFNPAKAEEFIEADSVIIFEKKSGEPERYDSIAAYIEKHEREIASAAGIQLAQVEFMAHIYQSAATFMRQRSLDHGPERTAVRDKGMAKTLEFIVNQLYPDKKVITWGHNFHLRHKNSAVKPHPVITMGEFLADKHRDERYTIGLYMGGGEAAFNNRKPYDIADVDTLKGHLEIPFAALEQPIVFLDLSKVELNENTRWLFKPVSALSWGMRTISFVPREQYDALLFIEVVSPPAYLEN